MLLNCKKCGQQYIQKSASEKYYSWCNPCQINNLKGNFTNWSSGNEKIDSFIQEVQLKIKDYKDIVFEWISYNQFSDIKEIGRGGFATVYSAIWNDGPLKYNSSSEEYTRKSDYKNYEVALKCLHNSQNITNEFLNEV